MSEVTKNQHYISQNILENFADTKQMIFEALVEENKVFKTNIRNAMSKRFMYEHEMFEVNTFEHFFQDYEGTLKTKVTELINFLESYNSSTESLLTLKSMVYDTMKLFLIMYYRSYALFEEYSFSEQTINKSKNDNILEMIEKISSGKYLYNLVNTICNNYSFSILESENEFLISDQFISTCSLNVKNRFFGLSNRQIGMKDIMILIPLSSRFYICYYHSSNQSINFKEDINKINSDQLNAINRVIINNSYNKCAGYKESVMIEALKCFEWQSPSGIIAGGFKNRPPMGATMKKELFYFQKDKEIWDFHLDLTSYWNEYKKLGRNDICLCGSGKKYKKCCQFKYLESKRMIDDLGRNDDSLKYLIHPLAIMEKGISEFNM